MAELIEGVTLAVEARASPMGSFLCVFHRVVPTTGSLRDLLPLSTAGVRSHLATALAAPFESRERAAAHWTLGITHSVNLLFCAGWSQHPVSLQRLSSLHPLQEDVVKRWFNAVEHFFSRTACVPPGRLSGVLGSLWKLWKLELQPDLVVPARPRARGTKATALGLFSRRNPGRPPVLRAVPQAERSEWPATPPRAKVHSSPQSGSANGQKVLNGAMAVAKRKRHEDGTETILQRFITNLIPTNSYLRRLRGDTDSLPRVGRLSLITLQDHEQLEVDSEDMVSAFNLFAVPEQWRGAFVFEKRVPGSVVAGGDPNVLIYVSIGTVPMGWVAAVDLIQQVARRIVFGMAKIPPELEVKPEGLFPHDGAWVLVYLDGLDVVRAVSDRFAARSAAEAGRERLRDQFVDTCDNLKLPLNAGKRLVRALGGPVLGGEIDGVRGLLSHNRGKGLELFARYVAFLGEEHWTGQGLQQIVGYFSFACRFRRPLFSVLAETYAEATAYPPLLPFTPSDAAVLEILLSALLIPLAFTDLRASVSRTISTSDASERAGAAAEATAFRAECHPRVQELAAVCAAEMNEESILRPEMAKNIACHCGRQVAPGAGAPCHGIVRSPFARHLVSPRTRWSARGGSFQELVWPSSSRRQAQDGRGLFNSLGF